MTFFWQKKQRATPSRYPSPAGRRPANSVIPPLTAKRKVTPEQPPPATVKKQKLFKPPDFLKDLFPSELSPEPEEHQEVDDDGDPTDDDDKDGSELIDLTSPRKPKKASISPLRPPPVSQNAPRQRTPDPLTGIPTPNSSFQSNSSYASGSSQNSSTNDDAAESLLRLRLLEEEKKKKRTTFIPTLPAPTPFLGRLQKPVPRANLQRYSTPFSWPSPTTSSNRQLNQVLHAQPQPAGYGQFATKKQADKAWNLSARWLKEAGEALKKNLEMNAQDNKALKENEEYQKYKAKFDQGTVLTGPERERLRAITHNTGRRLLKLENNPIVIKQGTQPPQNGERLEGKNVGSERQEVPIKQESPSHAVDMTPPSNNSAKPASNYPSSNIDKGTLRQSAPLSLPPPPPKSEPEEVHIKTEHEEMDIDNESSSGSEISDTESESTVESPPCYYQYHVFSREIGTPGACTDKYLSSFLSRKKAENLVRDEIMDANSATWDRSRMEIKTVMEDGGIQSQTLSFASGKELHVWIERELVERPAKEVQKAFRREKLNTLPKTFFIIMEEVKDVEEKDQLPRLDKLRVNSFPNSQTSHDSDSVDSTYCSADPEDAGGNTNGTKGHAAPVICNVPVQVWREGFIVRKHANLQASLRMTHYLTLSIPKEHQFDLELTWSIDTEERHYLHELEAGERLYSRTKVLPGVGPDGKVKQATIKVVELPVMGPRN